MTRLRGFTLIELLAAIAVVAILGAVLVPAISSIRSKGQMAQAVANIRSLQQANILYGVDNNGQYLAPRPNAGASGSWWYQYTLYTAYLGYSGKPSEAGERIDTYRGTVVQSKEYPDFGYNRTGLAESELVSGYQQRDITDPAGKIAFMDSMFTLVYERDKQLYKGEEKRSHGNSFEPAYRHDGHALVAFWDGHVRLVPRAELVAPDKIDMWYPAR